MPLDRRSTQKTPDHALPVRKYCRKRRRQCRISPLQDCNWGDLSVIKVETARLLVAGHVHADSKWTMAVHAHQEWEFLYFLRGSGRITIPDATLSPHPYHIVAYPPGLPHEEVTSPADPEETIFLQIIATGTPPVGAHLLLPDVHGEMGWLCERIFTEFDSAGSTPLANALTRAFLYMVERVWENAVSVKHDAADIVVQYIRANYAKDISLDGLAKIACVSKTRLVHVFSSRVGMSPFAYLRKVRLEIAKRMLTMDSAPIHEIAIQVGYPDPLYFSRAFKSAYGCSPRAYRENANCAI